MSATRSRHAPGKSASPPLRGLIPLAVLLVVWQLIATYNYSPFFPPPSRWWDALTVLAAKGVLIPAIATTVTTFLIALVIASLLGVILGFLVGSTARADRLLGPSFEFARATPAGALVPVAVLVIGYTLSMTLTVVVFAAIWPVILATRAAAKTIRVERLEAAKIMELGRFDTFRKVTLPSLMPNILLGIQLAAPLALIIVLVVETITQVSGIGKQLGLAQQGFQSAAAFGLVAVTGIIGLIVNLGVSWLGRLTRHYEA